MMNIRILAPVLGVAVSLLSGPAFATACPSTPTCTLDGQTFSLGTSLGGGDPAVNPDPLQDVFLATFTTPNQSNSAIAELVEDFLAAENIATDVNYLGRQDGSGDLPGTSVSVSGSGSSGTWTYSPGSTGALAGFFAIHAGDGQTDSLWEVISPSLSGVWSTVDNGGHGLSNFDLFDPGTPTTHVPEPITLSLFSAGLAGALAIRRRRKTQS